MKIQPNVQGGDPVSVRIPAVLFTAIMDGGWWLEMTETGPDGAGDRDLFQALQVAKVHKDGSATVSVREDGLVRLVYEGGNLAYNARQTLYRGMDDWDRRSCYREIDAGRRMVALAESLGYRIVYHYGVSWGLLRSDGVEVEPY